MTVDSPCKVPRTRFGISSLTQKEIARRLRAFEDELIASGQRRDDALLHPPQFDVEYLLKVGPCQSAEDDHFVQAIHELAGKLLFRGPEPRFIDSSVQVLLPRIRSRREP